MTDNVVHIAAIADLHCRSNFAGKFRALFSQISDTANILLLCGDLIDYGLPEEAHVLVKESAMPVNAFRSSLCWVITNLNPVKPTKCKKF